MNHNEMTDSIEELIVKVASLEKSVTLLKESVATLQSVVELLRSSEV